MPWTVVRGPSIQIGLLKALLDGHGIPTASLHLYVDFFDEVARNLRGKRVSVDRFESFGEAFGDWTFSVPPFRSPTAEEDETFRSLLADQQGSAWVNVAFRVRALVPAFLDRCADAILDRHPRVVGFSSTFQQNVPSLALSKLLKQRQPDLRVVLGGANCEGPMGAALHRRFPWIDVVVRGEAEPVVPRLFRELLAGGPVSRQTGLCIRDGEASIVCDERVVDDREAPPPSVVPMASLAGRPRARRTEELGGDGPVPMDSLPLPAYDDYFERLEGSPLAEHADRIWLPYESARGCWWAIKKVCTFCAANAQYLSFRSKQPEKVRREVLELSRRYGARRVWFVDNIMEERYLRELFPRMGDSPVPMFVETRAHVSKAQLRSMRDAGVVMVQLGIESFSTPILKLMDKGTTAMQNVRVIKWCAELGIKAFYNVIYGFPGEPTAEYDAMAEAIPSLSHLEPPNPPVPLRLDRFSPYHRDPERFGIEVTGPHPSRRFVYGLPAADLEEIEYFFTFQYKDRRIPASYVGGFLASCRAWRNAWPRSFRRLSYHRVAGGLHIYDSRPGQARVRHDLGEREARIYLEADAGITPRHAWEALPALLRAGIEPADVATLLLALTRRRLMFADGGRYAALAVEGDDALIARHQESGPFEVERWRLPRPPRP